jgi:hypothetical protein
LVLSLCGSTPLLACAESDAPSTPQAVGGSGGTGGNPTTPPQPAETTIPDPNANTAGAGGEGPFRDPLCGTDTCLPDDPSSCAGADVEPPPSEEPGGSGGANDEQAEEAVERGACRLVTSEGAPVAVCTAAGSGDLDAPCFSTDECGAGLACVGGGLAGRCRPFCCGGEGSCEQPGTYCSRQPQRELDMTSPLIVPVCVPADDCDLGEPFPCPSGRTCDCADGRACMVVRTEASGNQPGKSAGTTACVEPGTGIKGERCPCAFNHVCSAASGVCLELCQTVSVSDDSACKGRCQASSKLPPGWGVCIR